MPKVIIEFIEDETAEKFEFVLKSLKSFKCGLRSIASTLRVLLQKATVTRE